MRDLDTLLTSEMTQDEWAQFRNRWVQDYAQSLVVECDMSAEDALEIADIRFEDYVGQEGYTMRDMRIADSRTNQGEVNV